MTVEESIAFEGTLREKMTLLRIKEELSKMSYPKTLALSFHDSTNDLYKLFHDATRTLPRSSEDSLEFQNPSKTLSKLPFNPLPTNQRRVFHGLRKSCLKCPIAKLFLYPSVTLQIPLLLDYPMTLTELSARYLPARCGSRIH